MEEVPGTSDLENLKGAIQPIALNTKNVEEVGIECSEEEVEASDPTPIVHQTIEGSLTEMLQFRDGEHSGEASLQEIIEGHDDGELSDRCQIYDHSTDSWIAIEKYINNNDSTRSENEEQATTGDDPDPEPEEDMNPKVHALETPTFDVDKMEDFQPVTKNDRKKPKRDISAWGKGQIQPLTVKTEGVNSTEKDVSISRRKKSKHTKPPAKLMRLCTQAMIQWDMLEDGDRLLLGLSGGKDSMSLLHVLLEFQKKLPIRFDIEVSQKYDANGTIVH